MTTFPLMRVDLPSRLECRESPLNEASILPGGLISGHIFPFYKPLNNRNRNVTLYSRAMSFLSSIASGAIRMETSVFLSILFQSDEEYIG
jgi:hypothetical protein